MSGTRKEDMRVKRTKAALKNSLVELLEIETFDKITVSEICDKALINRVTFYGHYQDKYELFNDYLLDVKDTLIKKTVADMPLIKSITRNTEYFFTTLCDNFIDLCIENKALLRAFTFQENSMLTFMIQELATEELYKLFDDLKAELNITYDKHHICPFLVGGASRMVYEWLSHGGSLEQAQEYKKSCINIIKDAMRAIAKK